jgi:hypothetical protein
MRADQILSYDSPLWRWFYAMLEQQFFYLAGHRFPLDSICI